jgi:ketosteroid isomerase-like protein
VDTSAVADNVGIVQRFLETVNEYRVRRSAWDETLGRLYDPDVDYYPVRKFPDSKPCHGVDEMRAYYDSYWEAWETFDFDVLDLEAVGDDRVLAHMRLSGSGRGSGMEMAGDLYAGYWVRNGRIFRHEDHLTEAGARRGLGLES